MTIGVGQRSSGIVVACALAALFAACGSPREDEESASQRAALEDPDSSDATSDATSDGATDAPDDGGACRHADLIASKTYNPSAWQDATQTFAPSLKWKLPAEVPVLAGNAGNHWITISYSLGTSDAGPDAGGPVSCRFKGGASQAHPNSPSQIALGLKYVFLWCTNGATPGTIIEADRITVHVDNGDSYKSPTTVELALDEEQPCNVSSCNPQTCDDQNACNGVETCNGSACDPGTPPVVDDGNACTVDVCSPGTGVSHTPINVDDGDACTVDSCNALTGVSHTPVNTDDGDACTVDSCNALTGVSHTPVSVDDADACTVDSCNAITGVSHTPVNVDDADACTVDACNSQTGVTHTAIPIDDLNECTADACNALTGVSHVPIPQGALCGVAQDACSGAFACDGAGSCVQGPPPVTDDQNECTADSCNPITGVSHTPVSSGTACGDNSDKCVGAFACNETAQCVQGPAPVVDDQNPCTTDACVPSTGVSHTPKPQGTACGDNSNLCAGAFTCNGSAQCNQGPAPTVDDSNVCTIDACSPNTGVTHTPISGCDPSPTEGEGVFEKRASLLGRVVDKNGNAVSGATFQVRDLPADTPRNDVSLTTSGDGSFRIRLTTFADHEISGVGAQHVSLWIDSPNAIRAYRDAWVRPGDAPNLGDIVVVTRDPQITNIGPAGGTATDSQGLVEVVIPPGALAQTIPVQITPFLTRAQVPAVLPEGTLTTYAFELEPEGTQFAVPVTVRAKNTKNLPNTIAMPAGTYDPKLGSWTDGGSATLNGQFWQVSSTHFSTVDINGAKNTGLRIVTVDRGTGCNGGAEMCGGSTLGISNGALRQVIALPQTTIRGRAFGITLNYDSGLAGSRKFDYGPATTHTQGAVPQSSFTVALRGTRITSECVANGGGASGGGGNSCVAGSCILGSALSTPIRFDHNLPGATASNDQTLDPNQTSAESGTFLTVPLDDQTVPIGSGFLNHNAVITAGGGGACAAGAQSTVTFGGDSTQGAGVNVPLDPGPIAEYEQRVLVHHRHASPFGAGWGISEVGRLFVDGPDHVILVNGDGQEEDFRPRAERTPGFQYPNTDSKPVFARDPVTDELFAMTFSGGQLSKVNADLSITPMFSGLSLPGGRPHDMAIAYVNAQRVFVVAAENGLAKIDAGGTVTVLAARTPQASTLFTQAHVAARGELVYYISGEPTARVLYKLDLSAQSPTLTPLTITSNGDRSIDPQHPLAQLQLGEGTGLAMGVDGSLYMADKVKNALYRIFPDSQGAIGPTSVVRRVVGRQGGTFILPRGDRLPGPKLPLIAPIFVTAAPNGTILVATAYGLVQYDPATADAQWLALNKDYGNAPDLIEQWTTNDVPGNLVALGPRNFVFSYASRILRIDVPPALASQFMPTRTLELSAGQYFLVDGQAGTKEVYDAAGRLLESRMRTGEPVFSVEYVDATSARIKWMTDAVGGKWIFGYGNDGKLSTITDPSGRVDRFSVDGFGDLTTLTTAEGPDQEAHLFSYVGHKMTSKTSPAGQSTTYEYSANGNISKATKPTGEVTTMASALDSPPQKGANGSPLRVGSYTDAFGVTHTVTANILGLIDKDVWTADATTYTRQTIYDPVLYEGATDARLNTLFRPSYHLLNGVQEGRYVKWDARGRVLRIGFTSSPTSDYLFFGYDANDRLISRDDTLVATQDLTRWEYESPAPEARLARVYRPLFSGGFPTTTAAQQTQWFYTADPYLPSAMKTHGVQYDYGYDVKGNLATVKDGLLLGTTEYTRDARGNVTLVQGKDAANVVVTSSRFDFDTQDRLIASRDAQSNQTDYDYKWQGCGCTEGDKLTSVHTPDLPSGMKWALDYDPVSGRLKTLTDPDNHVTSMGYTPTTNRLSQVTDANTHSASMDYDQLGRLAGAQDALNRKYTRAYPTPAGGLWTGASVLAGSSNLTPAPTDLTAPLADGQYQIGIARYQGAGNPAELSFYRDATFELSYGMSWDRANRLTRRADRGLTPITTGTSLPAGAGGFDDQTFSYDIRTSGAATTRTDAQYGAFSEATTAVYNDELDVVSRVGDGQRLPRVQAESFVRDAAGRITQVSRTLSALMNEPSQLQQVPTKSSPLTVVVPSLQYQYDANGRVKQWTDADGVHDVFYDTRGLLAKITVQGEGDYVFTYDAVGRNTLLTYPGGFQRTQAFDHEGRLTDRCYAHPNATQRCYRASYDPVGNPLSLQDPEDTDTITYDNLDRLSTIQRGNATQTYAYNALGALHQNDQTILDDQRPKLAGGGNASSAVPFTFNSTPVTLDGGGRITLLDGVNLKYSRRGALIGATKVSGPTTLGEWYGHDPDGHRIARVVSSTTANVTTFPDEEYFAWTGGNVVARLEKTGAVRQGFLFEGIDKPLRLRDAASNLKYYYELDIAGNVRRLRRTDGSDAGGYRYSGFGVQYPADQQTPSAQVDQPLRWKGRWWSDFAKIYDVRARQWSPEIGSFTSIDEFAAFDETSTLWAWGNENPIRFSDPSGRDATEDNPVQALRRAGLLPDSLAHFGAHAEARNDVLVALANPATADQAAKDLACLQQQWQWEATRAAVNGFVSSALALAADPLLEGAEIAVEEAAVAQPKRNIVLWRGVPSTTAAGTPHPQYAAALEGRVVPWGGHADPALHNLGDTQSVFTSWSTEEGWGRWYGADKLQTDGALLELHLSESDPRIVASPDAHGEREVLIRGSLDGVAVTRITPRRF